MNSASQSGPMVARARSRTSSAVMRPSAVTSGARNVSRRTVVAERTRTRKCHFGKAIEMVGQILF
jgi:hypothetical protein